MIEIYQQQMNLITDWISKVALQGVQIEKQVTESKTSLSTNIIKLQDQMEKSYTQVSQNVQNETKEIQKSLKQSTAMQSQQQSTLEKINSSNTEITNNLKQYSQQQVNSQEISQIKVQISKVAVQGVQIEKLFSESKSSLSTNIIKLQDQMENNFKEQKSNTLVIQNISKETKDIQSNFQKIILIENQQQNISEKLSSSNTEISNNQKEQLQSQSNLNQQMIQNQNAIKVFNEESKAKFDKMEQGQSSYNRQQKNILDLISKLEKQFTQVQNEMTNLSKNQSNIESIRLLNKIQDAVLQILRDIPRIEMDQRKQTMSVHFPQQSSEATLKVKTEENELNQGFLSYRRTSFYIKETDGPKKISQQQQQQQK